MFRVNAKAIASVLGGAAGITGLAVGIGALIDACTKYDKDGYDAEGYDREGFSRTGYDHQGRDRQGYDSAGYNREGFNRLGFDVDG